MDAQEIRDAQNGMYGGKNKPITDGKVHEWPIYDLTDKKVMVLDEKDIHPAEESELKIVDWERTYFLTNYYMP